MGLNTLKNVSASLVFVFLIGCESDALVGPQNEDRVAHIIVTMVNMPDMIELNDYSWQTLRTLYGNLESEDVNVEHTRIEWFSDMYWVVGDTSGYFRLDCRECIDGTWYDSDGSTLEMRYDFHSMAPVTNQVSMANSDGDFGNVIAPVRSMVGHSMWLWWSIHGTVVDSMSIFLME